MLADRVGVLVVAVRDFTGESSGGRWWIVKWGLLEGVFCGDALAPVLLGMLMVGCGRWTVEEAATVAFFTPVTCTSSSSSVRSMTEPLGRAPGAAALEAGDPEAWLSVFDVRDVPCGGPGAVEPVAAGPEVAGEEAEDMAPATGPDCAGVLAVVTDTPALGVVIPPVPPW